MCQFVKTKMYWVHHAVHMCQFVKPKLSQFCKMHTKQCTQVQMSVCSWCQWRNTCRHRLTVIMAVVLERMDEECSQKTVHSWSREHSPGQSRGSGGHTSAKIGHSHHAEHQLIAPVQLQQYSLVLMGWSTYSRGRRYHSNIPSLLMV